MQIIKVAPAIILVLRLLHQLVVVVAEVVLIILIHAVRDYLVDLGVDLVGLILLLVMVQVSPAKETMAATLELPTQPLFLAVVVVAVQELLVVIVAAHQAQVAMAATDLHHQFLAQVLLMPVVVAAVHGMQMVEELVELAVEEMVKRQ
jgi:hypothetical protein